jgi:hypothetical protein
LVAAALACGCGRFGFARHDGADGDATGGDTTGDDGPHDSADGLASRGLVVRYFLDEAASGQGVSDVRDHAAPVFDLPVTYDNATTPPWTTTPTGRGLAFDTIGLDGGACRPVSGKLLALDDLSNATLEVRVEAISDCLGSGSRFMHIGEDDRWGFALGCLGTGTVVYAHGDVSQETYTEWPVVLGSSAITLTLVFEAGQALPQDRVRLYVDGVVRAFTITEEPSMGDPLIIGTTQHLCIGNRPIGGRSPRGTISYAAIYAVALTPAEIADNVARLAVSDDP